MKIPSIFGKIIKKTIRTGRLEYAFIVSSLGRCGSDLVTNALVGYFVNKKLYLDRFADVNSYDKNTIYKTHDLPPKHLPNNVKVIYLFANPFDTVISASKMINDWGRLHHLHLNSNLFEENYSLYYKDTLLLAKNFEAWYKSQAFPFISIKYEFLYEKETLQALSDFLGFRLPLPPYHKRESNYLNHPMEEQLLKVYSDLFNKIENAEKVKIWEKTPITVLADI